jgi:hypothetical protein
MNVDVVPVREVVRDRAVSRLIRVREILQRRIGEYDAPAERVVGPIALVHDDLVLGILFFEQQRQVEAGRSGADHRDVQAGHR